MAEFTFNLIDKPWIPCSDIDGKYVKVGLRDLFAKAHVLRAIQHQNPLTEAALLRVVLAVVHRAVKGPRNGRDWKTLYQTGQFDARITEYLERWRHRFDLFSEEAPFYQTPGLQVIDGEKKPLPQNICSLMLERASGNNKTLFDHTTAETPARLLPDVAAHVLITAQMFSLGGLNKKTTNVFGYQQSYLNSTMVNGIFIVLTGKNLFETLMLNLLIYDDNEPIPTTKGDDFPVWERSDIGGSTNKTPRGYLDFLTCKCRHLRLVPNRKNGEIFVEHVHVAQGEAFPEVRNPGFMRKKRKDGAWYHPQLDVDRLLWRDSTALFAFDEHIDERPKAFRHVQAMKGTVDLPKRYVCMAYAIANDKANPLAWRRESLSVSLSLLSNKEAVAYLEKGMSLCEKGAAAVESAAKTFMRNFLPKNSKDITEKVRAVGAIRNYWDQMEGHFRQFLLDLDTPETALEEWHEAIKRTARASLNLSLKDRYTSSGRAYLAWTRALEQLDEQLAKLIE